MAEIYEKAAAVRLSPGSKAYYYDANGFEFQNGDYVIVETLHGNQIGQALRVVENYVNEGDPLKVVVRLATPRDLIAKELFNQQKDAVLEFARTRLVENHINGVKIFDAEFNYEGNRLQLFYASDNDEKVDLKAVKFDVLRKFPSVSAVDLRQMGPRDVAKSVAGMGACGLINRCCSRYLTEFSSISIKMAKEQGISLTPTEITGMCGRLRCCLVYENDYYVECRKLLPKKNKHVVTPQGEGKVVEVFPLRDAVLVDIPDVGRREYKRDQITVEDTPQQEAKPRKEKEVPAEKAEKPGKETRDREKKAGHKSEKGSKKSAAPVEPPTPAAPAE